MIDEALIVPNVVTTSRQHPHQQNAAHLEAHLHHVARRANATEIAVHAEEKIELERGPDTNGVHERTPRYHQREVRMTVRIIEVDIIEIQNTRTHVAILLAPSTTSPLALRITKETVIIALRTALALAHRILDVGGIHLQTTAGQEDITHLHIKVTGGNLQNRIVISTKKTLAHRLVVRQENY